MLTPRVTRQQKRRRAATVAAAPHIHIRVTIERMQGTIVLSSVKGTGNDLADALWNARSRAKNAFRVIGEHLAHFPGEPQ